MESLRRAMLAYHRQNNDERFEHGVSASHLYPGEPALSWWDDVTLISGKCRVAVTWQHPRMIYQDRIEDAAMRANEHLYSDKNLFANSTPIHQRIGRSRKKVSGYRTETLGNNRWFEAVRTEEARLSLEASYTVEPSMQVTWTAWSRLVSICAPVEVRNIDELKALDELVRRLLKGQASMGTEFPSYVYTQQNWIAEKLANRPLCVHSMAIAL